MVTPGSTAPDASFTTPVILPLAFCAFAGAQIRRTPRKVVIQRGVYRPLIAFLLRFNRTQRLRTPKARSTTPSAPLACVSPIRRCVTVSYTHLRAHETPEHLVCR